MEFRLKRGSDLLPLFGHSPHHYFPLNVVFSSLVVNLCLSGFFQTVTKSKSQFKALLNAAIYAKTLSNCWKYTHTHRKHTIRTEAVSQKLHTKCLQSGRRRFKMADS